MKKFAIVLLAVGMSVSAASAATMKPMMHHKMMHHMMAACKEGGAVKASCMCKPASGKGAMCKPGQWCHSFAGVCTM